MPMKTPTSTLIRKTTITTVINTCRKYHMWWLPTPSCTAMTAEGNINIRRILRILLSLDMASAPRVLTIHYLPSHATRLLFRRFACTQRSICEPLPCRLSFSLLFDTPRLSSCANSVWPISTAAREALSCQGQSMQRKCALLSTSFLRPYRRIATYRNGLLRMILRQLSEEQIVCWGLEEVWRLREGASIWYRWADVLSFWWWLVSVLLF